MRCHGSPVPTSVQQAQSQQPTFKSAKDKVNSNAAREAARNKICTLETVLEVSDSTGPSVDRAGESEACSQSTTVEGADHFDPRFHPTFRETRRRIRSRGHSRVQVARGGPGAVAPRIGDGHTGWRTLGLGTFWESAHVGTKDTGWVTGVTKVLTGTSSSSFVTTTSSLSPARGTTLSNDLQSLSTWVERDRLRLKQGPSLFNRLLRSTLGPGFVVSPTHDPRYPHRLTVRQELIKAPCRLSSRRVSRRPELVRMSTPTTSSDSRSSIHSVSSRGTSVGIGGATFSETCGADNR